MKIISIFKEDRLHLGKTQINLVFLSICTIFASKNPKAGGAPSFLPPVGCQSKISNFILTFQILSEIASLIGLWVFRFSYSLQGFRHPLSSSLLTLQRYGKYLKPQNFFKIISRGNENFSPESFGVSQKHVIFATSNLHCGTNAAGNVRLFLCQHFTGNRSITAPCRVSGNRPGASAMKSLTARSAVLFLCQNFIVMQIRKESGSVQPSGDVLHGRVLRQPSRRSGAIREKKSPKNFGVSQKHVIFATSKLQMRYECRRKYPAIFVPSLYWIHRITMPCRVSGNRPGGLAFGALTARSMVTFLCQKQMQIRKENVPAFTLLTWREMLTGAARKWQEWKQSENVWLSAWCQERVTNGEAAAVAMAVCVVLPAMLCVMGLVLEGGAL